MNLTHKIALDPTAKQRIALGRACGVARFTYNWALAEWKRQYEAGENPTSANLKIQFGRGSRLPSFPAGASSGRSFGVRKGRIFCHKG